MLRPTPGNFFDCPAQFKIEVLPLPWSIPESQKRMLVKKFNQRLNYKRQKSNTLPLRPFRVSVILILRKGLPQESEKSEGYYRLGKTFRKRKALDSPRISLPRRLACPLRRYQNGKRAARIRILSCLGLLPDCRMSRLTICGLRSRSCRRIRPWSSAAVAQSCLGPPAMKAGFPLANKASGNTRIMVGHTIHNMNAAFHNNPVEWMDDLKI